MAWLAAIYLTFQLISIPFALPSAPGRFIGVVDGMASLVPLAVVLVAVFGKPHLIGTWPRWEAAFLLISSPWSICSVGTPSTSRSAAAPWMSRRLRRPEVLFDPFFRSCQFDSARDPRTLRPAGSRPTRLGFFGARAPSVGEAVSTSWATAAGGVLG